MNTQQIEDVMATVESRRGDARRVFYGVFARDEIPTIDITRQFPISFIANTDAANEPGKHWVAFYFKSHNAFEFFDSFAMASPILYRFKNISSDAVCTNKLAYPIQSPASDACGQHCLYFLIHRYRISFDSIKSHYSPQNLARNDLLVTKFIFRLFHSITSYDSEAIPSGAGKRRTNQFSINKNSFIGINHDE